MAGRIIATMAALGMAGAAFCGEGLARPGVNLFGVLFLFLAFIFWFEWGSIREGYSYMRDNDRRVLPAPDLWSVRAGPLIKTWSPRKPEEPPKEPATTGAAKPRRR